MQQLVADVAKKPFAEVARRLVLDPAGMRHSTYEQPLPARLSAQAATAIAEGFRVQLGHTLGTYEDGDGAPVGNYVVQHVLCIPEE